MSDSLRINRRDLNGLALTGLGSMLLGGGWAKTAAADEPQKPAEVYGDPLPFVDGSFTIAALPDTQIYCERYPQHFLNQTEWIVSNRDKRGIAFVTHLGDITNRNTKPQWEVAQQAIQKLDGHVPYSLVLGNHDCGPGGNCTTRETMLNDYVPQKTYEKQKTFGGVMKDGEIENSYHTFTAGGKKFLVLALEFGPRDATVEWADSVVSKHPDHRVLLTTHAYMYYDETRYDWKKRGKDQTWNPHTYGVQKLDGGVNDAEELWNKMIAKHDNFFMTINGHVLNDGLGRMTSTTPKGNDVHQHLVNYQMKKEGGEGFMRLVEFLPDGETVQIKAYSPSIDKYKVDEQNQFTLKLKPGLKR